MKTTDAPRRYGRRALTNEERKAALPAVPAARTNGSTGRQHVAAARTLPTAEMAATKVPLEGDFPAVVIALIFMMVVPRTTETIGQVQSRFLDLFGRGLNLARDIA